MVIGIDLRCLPQDGSPGAGVAHAARELARALVSSVMDSAVSWILYLPRGASWDADERLTVRRIEVADSTGGALRKALRDVPCDVLLAPSGAVPPRVSALVIPWVHDLAIFAHPEWFPQNFFRRALTTTLFRRGIMRAPRVLAVSQNTKDDIVQLFGVDPSIVSVTHEGGDSVLGSMHGAALREAKQRAKRRLADRGVTQAFILAMGTVEPRKNLPLLLSVWQKLVPLLDRPVDLVIAGRDGWKLGSFLHAMHKASYVSEGGARLHRIASVTDDDRRDLLLAADVVAVPSLHEGFGLTALEAMQAEVVVIASDVGAHPEIVQDAGLLLSPTDVGSWVGALRGVLSDDLTRAHMAEQGKAQSQGLTWARAAHIAFQSLTEA